MSEVSNMISEKLTQAPASAPSNENKKMIVFITEANSAILGNLSKLTGVGKIELGSKLLELAVNDAKNAAVKANKMNDKGEIPGQKPKEAPAPAAPKAPEVPKA